MASEFRLIKCAKKEPQHDWISQLPDDILVHILSLLTLEDAARTSVLSTRWIDLWLNVCKLDFDSAKIWRGVEGLRKMPNYLMVLERSRCSYVEWVNKVLQSHNAVVLDLFRIRFYLNKSSRYDIDRWLQHAFARRVHRLELNLSEYDGLGFQVRYDFPKHLLGLSYGNSSAPCSSDCCGNTVNSDVISFDFKSLKSLTLRCVNVSGEVLEYFLHSCPALEYLLVENSQSLETFKACGPSLALKHLELRYCLSLKSLTVCDTKIVSLRTTEGHSLVLKNVPMLVDVFVAGRCMKNNANPNPSLVHAAVSWLSCCLSTIEVLTLRMTECDVRRERCTNATLPQLTKLKQLTFCVFAPRGCSLMAFTCLVRLSPKLEKFIVKFDRKGDEDMQRTVSEKGVAFPLKHVKVVELWGYSGRRMEVELVEYFVENAVALEKIVIDPRDLSFNRLPKDNPKEDAKFREIANKQLKGWLREHVELVLL